MTQNPNSTSTTLPTTRKSRRASQRNRPVLVSSTTKSTSQEAQEFQGSQVEPLVPKIVHTGPLAEEFVVAETPEVPTQAKRSSRLPSFFSKVEKAVEEPGISQEEVVKARLARAKKTASKAEVTSTANETKARDEKPASSTNRTAATARPNRLFKTRHLIGMMLYLFGAEILLPQETVLLRNFKLEQTLTTFTLFNLPMTVTTSVILNLVTLVGFLLLLVKFDLLPKSMSGNTAAARARQQHTRAQQAATDRQPQPTMRQGVKGEHDDLYQAYRSNQRRDKKR